jgi:hypothetical protein
VIYSYNKSQHDALFLNFILVNNSTCLGQTYCPSSGVLILYLQQLVAASRQSTYWVGHRAGLIMCRKPCRQRDSIPGPSFTPGKDLVPIVQEAGCVCPRAGPPYLTILCIKSTLPAKTVCKRIYHKIPSYNLTFHIFIEPDTPTRPTLSVCPMTDNCDVSFRI